MRAFASATFFVAAFEAHVQSEEKPALVEAAAVAVLGHSPDEFASPSPGRLILNRDHSVQIIVRDADPKECIVDVFGRSLPGTELRSNERIAFAELMQITTESYVEHDTRYVDHDTRSERHSITLIGNRIRCILKGTPEDPMPGACQNEIKLFPNDTGDLERRKRTLAQIAGDICTPRPHSFPL
jgi:hypothetical protein